MIGTSNLGSWPLIFNSKVYPLVICYIANWTITMLYLGKSTISMTIFQFANCLFTREGKSHEIPWKSSIFHHFPMENHNFPMENHHFPLVCHHFPMENHHFPMENHHFPMVFLNSPWYKWNFLSMFSPSPRFR